MAITPYSGALWRGRRVGLLGGSFNPAHEGHRHISLYALKMLGLDAVWWMVSPQNPLKPAAGMAPQAARVQAAQAAARHPAIHVTDIENSLHTRYTIDTLQALKSHFAATNFVWLMGTDNLRQFHRWHRWQEIFEEVPVCVLDRPPRGNSIRQCPAAQRFAPDRLPQAQARLLPLSRAPAWTLLHIPLNSLSATEIRDKQRENRL